jgi:CO dehydrogenase/acetyl-CoA synthase beta subunit
VEITEEDHKVFGDFLDWVKSYNDGIVSAWDTRVSEKQDEVSEEDMETVEDFIDVEMDSDAK